MHQGSSSRLLEVVDAIAAEPGLILVLTGAGISAESGIPTFRGQDGFWKAGSKNYAPTQIATAETFVKDPMLCWSWHLYLRSRCLMAHPNPAHRALVKAEKHLGDELLLVTQNVDGLHLRAGSSTKRTWQIHGNIDFMRCFDECGAEAVPIRVADFDEWPRGRLLDAAEAGRLVCPACGGRARPNVLWFDEYYDEERYRFESSMKAAHRAAAMIVVGTSGMTNLPINMGMVASTRRIPMIVVGPEPSPFSAWADMSESGLFLQGPAGTHVPALCDALISRLG